MPLNIPQAPSPLGFADGPTFTTPAATVTDISPVPGRIIRSALIVPGTIMRVRAFGTFSSSATSSSLQIGLYSVTPGSAITAASPAAVPIAVSPLWTWVNTSSVAWPWFLEWEGEFRGLTTIAGGATGSVKGQGWVAWPASLSLWNTGGTPATPAPFPGLSAAARTVSLDTSIDKLLSVGALFTSITTGAPTLICEHLGLELITPP